MALLQHGVCLAWVSKYFPGKLEGSTDPTLEEKCQKWPKVSVKCQEVLCKVTHLQREGQFLQEGNFMAKNRRFGDKKLLETNRPPVFCKVRVNRAGACSENQDKGSESHLQRSFHTSPKSPKIFLVGEKTCIATSAGTLAKQPLQGRHICNDLSLEISWQRGKSLCACCVYLLQQHLAVLTKDRSFYHKGTSVHS